LTHPQDIDAPLHIAAQRKINIYGQQYADNHNISFLPDFLSTSTRMHGEFLSLLFLQAHRETEAHFTGRNLKAPYCKWLAAGDGASTSASRMNDMGVAATP
jgi:hypothetical protein